MVGDHSLKSTSYMKLHSQTLLSTNNTKQSDLVKLTFRFEGLDVLSIMQKLMNKERQNNFPIFTPDFPYS